MKQFITAALVMAAATCTLVACDDDEEKTIDNVLEDAELALINKNFVENVVVPTYTNLADAAEKMVEELKEAESSHNLTKVCLAWKEARKYWEYSEAFLFGAAAGYSIDPHIDTWPFDNDAFDRYMELYKSYDLNNEANEKYSSILSEAIATGQNLTGFHAVEYLIFRDGKERQYADLTSNELWFAKEAASDLYLNAIKLVFAWNGNVSEARQELLDEAEIEIADNFGEEFINAGTAGSRWHTPTHATIQIIEGARDIIGEVAEGKIGAAYHSDDPDYIESPNAHNSITDFYDNIMSVKHALYGTLSAKDIDDATKATSGSLMAYSYLKHTKEALAVSAALENALLKISIMKAPFVYNATDASAGVAIEALNELDESLKRLQNCIEGNE